MRGIVRLALHLSLAAVALADTPSDVATVDSADAADEAAGAFRIENEYMLTIPPEQCEPLRDFLRRRYGPGEESCIPEIGAEFTSRISDEGFVDEYFDTPELGVLAIEGGIRHRSRRNLENKLTDRKDGRQLVQLKLPRPGDSQVLNRTEIKFDVHPETDPVDDLDLHPLIGLVGHEQREPFLETVAQRGFDARDMRHTMTIEQRRWRVYISRRGTAFATLTLDEAVAWWGPWRSTVNQLEIELSEIFYTEADKAGRAYMQAVSDRIKKDITTQFPGLVQDQTPKYNKMYRSFSQRLPRFDLLLLHKDLIFTVVLVSGLWLVVGGAALRRRRRQSAAKTPTALGASGAATTTTR